MNWASGYEAGQETEIIIALCFGLCVCSKETRWPHVSPGHSGLCPYMYNVCGVCWSSCGACVSGIFSGFLTPCVGNRVANSVNCNLMSSLKIRLGQKTGSDNQIMAGRVMESEITARILTNYSVKVLRCSLWSHGMRVCVPVVLHYSKIFFFALFLALCMRSLNTPI